MNKEALILLLRSADLSALDTQSGFLLQLILLEHRPRDFQPPRLDSFALLDRPLL